MWIVRVWIPTSGVAISDPNFFGPFNSEEEAGLFATNVEGDYPLAEVETIELSPASEREIWLGKVPSNA